MLKITLLCDNKKSWAIPYIEKFNAYLKQAGYESKVIHSINNLPKNRDILFLLSCETILSREQLDKHQHNIVIHASDLPHGKGWSPVTWQILEGKNKIPVTLFEAIERVDSGAYYLKDYIVLEGHELNEEIKYQQWQTTKKMILEFLRKYPAIEAKKMTGEETFYPKRTPKDSQLTINQTIQEQFDLLRVVDNDRYPAFFDYQGHRYYLKIYKAKGEDNG